jgi:hypothetical protein
MLRFSLFLITCTILLVGFSMVVLGAQSARSQDEFQIYLPIVFKTEIIYISPTQTPTPTQTWTPTRTRTPFRSSTPRPTSTLTPTYTFTPTNTNTPTSTPTTTLIPLPSVTIRFPSHTPTLIPSRTLKPISTPTPTQPIGLLANLKPAIWIPVILIALMWVILAMSLILFLRRQV